MRASTERVDEVAGEALEVLVQRSHAGVSHTRARRAPLTQRRRWAGPSWATGRPATVIVNSSPASARRTTSATLLRNSFCGIVGTAAGGSSAT
jgi:hypothetical protein